MVAKLQEEQSKSFSSFLWRTANCNISLNCLILAASSFCKIVRTFYRVEQQRNMWKVGNYFYLYTQKKHVPFAFLHLQPHKKAPKTNSAIPILINASSKLFKLPVFNWPILVNKNYLSHNATIITEGKLVIGFWNWKLLSMIWWGIRKKEKEKFLPECFFSSKAASRTKRSCTSSTPAWRP